MCHSTMVSLSGIIYNQLCDWNYILLHELLVQNTDKSCDPDNSEGQKGLAGTDENSTFHAQSSMIHTGKHMSSNYENKTQASVHI